MTGPPRRDVAPIPPETNRLATVLVDAALKVHRHLGPGLLESVYEECLVTELRLRGLTVGRQVAVAIEYEGIRLDSELRLDLLVENAIIVELKVVESLSPLHRSQVPTYLRLSGKRLGFLLNFNVRLLRDGIVRIAL